MLSGSSEKDKMNSLL